MEKSYKKQLRRVRASRLFESGFWKVFYLTETLKYRYSEKSSQKCSRLSYRPGAPLFIFAIELRVRAKINWPWGIKNYLIGGNQFDKR